MFRGMNVTRSDERLFDRARLTALGGTHVRVRVGALLARGTRSVVSAHNVAGQVLGEQFFPGHAERRVINGQPAFKGTLYVARLELNGSLAASWPCTECIMHVHSCGCVTKLVYYDGRTLVKVRL